MWGWGSKPQAIEWKYDDLPTPTTDEEMIALLEKEKEIRLKWINGTAADGWRVFTEINGIKIEELEIPGSSIHVVRAKGILKGVNKDQMFESLKNGGIEERRKVSAELVQHDVIYQIQGQETMYLTYSAFNAPMGVSNREFVSLREHFVLEGGADLIVTQSINYQAKPFSANHVRASMRNARLFEPTGEEGTYKVSLVDHVDPRGNVPGWVVNMFKKKAGEAFLKLQQAYGSK